MPVAHQDRRLMWGQEVSLAGMWETEALLTAANWDDNGVAEISTRSTECPVALLQPSLTWPKQAGIYWHRIGGIGTENKC